MGFNSGFKGLNKKNYIYSYLKCIVYGKLLKPRQSFLITLYIYLNQVFRMSILVSTIHFVTYITGQWGLIYLLYVKIIHFIDRTDLLKIYNLVWGGKGILMSLSSSLAGQSQIKAGIVS